MYRMRLSTFRMKTCAALNGAVESTVPDTLAVPDSPACAAAGFATADPLRPKTTPAIARHPINEMISTDDLLIFQFPIAVPPREWDGGGPRPLIYSLSGKRMMKPSRFGIRTLGSV